VIVNPLVRDLVHLEVKCKSYYPTIIVLLLNDFDNELDEFLNVVFVLEKKPVCVVRGGRKVDIR